MESFDMEPLKWLSSHEIKKKTLRKPQSHQDMNNATPRKIIPRQAGVTLQCILMTAGHRHVLRTPPSLPRLLLQTSTEKSQKWGLRSPQRGSTG